jgi:hypothetical protein
MFNATRVEFSTKAVAAATSKAESPVTGILKGFPNTTSRLPKKVSFAPDTKFEPSRVVGAAGEDGEYNRLSKNYKPGVHACTDPDGYEDTSFADDIAYTLHQMPVFGLSTEDDRSHDYCVW